MSREKWEEAKRSAGFTAKTDRTFSEDTHKGRMTVREIEKAEAILWASRRLSLLEKVAEEYQDAINSMLVCSEHKNDGRHAYAIAYGKAVLRALEGGGDETDEGSGEVGDGGK